LRICQNRPIKVFEPSAARYIGGQTHDISATGLRIELPVSSAVRRCSQNLPMERRRVRYSQAHSALAWRPSRR
jgi:hypothetical protein